MCGSYLETDDAREEEMIRVNVEAMARLFRFAVRRMHAAGGGTILNVASSAGLLPGGPYMAGYYASKAYVVSLTRGVARELQELHSPVYVCALCPGPVDTEFNDRAGVVFALKGITPEFCVQEAMHGMMHRRTIIVPSAFMRACTTAQKLLPASLLMPIVARQQKKKLDDILDGSIWLLSTSPNFPPKLCAPLMTETVYTRKPGFLQLCTTFTKIPKLKNNQQKMQEKNALTEPKKNVTL